MRKIRKYLLLLLTPVIVFMGLTIQQSVDAASGKELSNVITDVSLWDVSNGETLKPDSSGVYSLVKDNSYRFASQFDLSGYDGKLNDGDYFTLTIPAPVTIENTSFDLTDKETGVIVGTAAITSNGDSQGGTVTVTLKNLKDYLAKKGGSQIQGVKGTFYTDFKVTKTLDNQIVKYKESETNKKITHTISVKEADQSDYSDTIKKENYIKFGGVMKQEDWHSDVLNQSGKYIHNWFLRVNTNQSSYDTITLNDTIPDDSAPMQLIPEKLKVYAGYFDSTLNLKEPQLLTEGKDYVIKYNSAYTNYELKILNTSIRLASNGQPAAYNVYYSTTSPANGTNVVNILSMKGNDKTLTYSKESQKTELRVERSTKVTTGGTIQLDTGYRITLYKQDADTGKLINGAEFEITSPSGEKEAVRIEKDGVGQSKVYSAGEVAKGKFTIIETKAPKGYVLDKTPIKVTVGENGIIRTIKNTKEKRSIPVMKKWEDGDNQDGKRPENVIVQLYINGNIADGQTVTLNAANNWTAQFENLAKTDDDGKEIVYTVKEVDVDGYISKVLGDVGKGYTITNTHKPEVIDISGKKIWSDNNNQDGKRPDYITVNLLANGKQVETKKVTANNNWQYNFKNLPKYSGGTEIVYAIEESPVDGYTATTNGYDLTNTYTPGKVDISGTKTWNDNDNQDGKRPNSITVNLLANGKKVDSQKVTSANNWVYQFTDLPQYENGQLIRYTVSEDAVDGYSTSIKGYDITNSYTPETVDIKATKNWQDNNNQDGKRPSSIIINLLANGEKVDSQEVTAAADGTWTASFTKLPKYKNGKKIKYTVTEEAVKEYETEIKDFTITNKYIPKSIEYKVTKVWQDNNNQDGKRPSSITVQLYKSVGGAKPTPVVGKTLTLTTKNQTDDNTWAASFTNLSQFENGHEIIYSVQEVDTPEGYTASVKGQLITNSHVPETISLSGQKTWKDNNNQDGIRPKSITLHLLANGTDTGLTAIVNADTNWTYSFKKVAKYQEGKEIVYTVSEDAVEGYTSTVDGMNVTNTHIPTTPKSEKPSSPSSNQKEKVKQSSLLPATGDRSGLKLIVLGIILVVATISGIIYYKLRKI